MKAIELIKALVYDSVLAENGGLVEWGRDITLRDYFGAVLILGEMECGFYFYVYEDQYDWLADLPKADVFLETEDAGNVYLWKLED